MLIKLFQIIPRVCLYLFLQVGCQAPLGTCSIYGQSIEHYPLDMWSHLLPILSYYVASLQDISISYLHPAVRPKETRYKLRTDNVDKVVQDVPCRQKLTYMCKQTPTLELKKSFGAPMQCRLSSSLVWIALRLKKMSRRPKALRDILIGILRNALALVV